MTTPSGPVLPASNLGSIDPSSSNAVVRCWSWLTPVAMISTSAGDSTTPGDALHRNVDSDTSAVSVPLMATQQPVARPKSLWSIYTPLNYERWAFYLEKHSLTSRFAHVLDGIKHGFSYRSSMSITKTIIHKHHPSALAHPHQEISKSLTRQPSKEGLHRST
jgi:hypothetical protein